MDQAKPPATHAITTPNKRPPTEIEVLRKNMEGEFLVTVENYYRGKKEDALAFKTAAVDYVRKVPKLLEVNRISLLSALVQAAQFRFMPAGVNGEAYIIPYGNEAKFQIGYQGYVTLFYRAGVKSVKANIVYSNEHFRYEEGIETILEHTPTKFGEKKGDPIGVYAVAVTPTGGRVFKVMSKEEVMAIKELSKAKNAKDSPWNSDKDPELWMWKKTCLIQLSKLLPKTRDIQQALEVDYEGEGSDRPAYDPAGPAVGKAFHTPDEQPVHAEVRDVTPTEPKEVPAGKCPAGKHDRSRMSEDGIDCMACLDEATADPAPAMQEPIQMDAPAEEPKA